MRRGEAICVRTGTSVSKISVVYIIQHLADAIVDVRSNQLPCMHGHIYNSQRSLYGIVDEFPCHPFPWLFPCHLNMCSVRGYSARTRRKTSKLPDKGFPLPLWFLPVLPLGTLPDPGWVYESATSLRRKLSLPSGWWGWPFANGLVLLLLLLEAHSLQVGTMCVREAKTIKSPPGSLQACGFELAGLCVQAFDEAFVPFSVRCRSLPIVDT